MARRNLNKLAKQLAPAYDSASPADVEDDVSLSAWVRKEVGEELTLKQVEKLRTLLDAEIDLIHRSGNIVQSSYPRGRSTSITAPSGKRRLHALLRGTSICFSKNW